MPQDGAFDEDRPASRRYRGPPQFFALTPGAPAPYARLRPLRPDDRGRLLRHLRALGRPVPAAARLLADLSGGHGTLPGLAAVARGEIIGLALALDLRPDGMGAAISILPAWPQAMLERLLGARLLASPPAGPALGETRQLALADVLHALGGRLVPPQRLGQVRLAMSAATPPAASAAGAA
jgi:hypothetical protein